MRAITRRRRRLFSGTQGHRLVGMVAELEALDSFSQMCQATLRAINVLCWQRLLRGPEFAQSYHLKLFRLSVHAPDCVLGFPNQLGQRLAVRLCHRAVTGVKFKF